MFSPSKSEVGSFPSGGGNCLFISPAESPSGSGSVDVIPGEGGPFPSSSAIPQQGGDGSVSEFLSRVPRAPQKSPLKGMLFYACII